MSFGSEQHTLGTGGDNVLLSIGFGSEEGRCYFDDGTSGLFDGCSQPQNASRTVCNCV